jgi:hypothetical protein
MNWSKPIGIGALVGLADGLAFVGCFHSAWDGLAPYLLIPAYPCYFVAMKIGGRFPSPEWLPWTAGVLALAVIGAVIGAGVGWWRRDRHHHA